MRGKVEDQYKWLWLYAAVEPSTGESFCLYMPHLDGECFEIFLRELSRAYPGEDIALVMDGAGAHRRTDLFWPGGVEGVELPAYSPELNPAERWFRELRARLSNCVFSGLGAIEAALTEALRPFWQAPQKLARLTGYGWWIDSISETPTS